MEREQSSYLKHVGALFTISVTLGKTHHFITPNCVICTLGITIILTLWVSMVNNVEQKR